MRRLLILPLLLLVVATGPAAAAGAARFEPLFRALAFDELIAIMREEGLSYGADLEADMFAGRGGDRWADAVAQIYDPDRMQDRLTETLADELAETDLDPLIAFFTSETGARIVRLELSARRALLDPEVETSSIERLEEMQADDVPRLHQIERFVAVNHLVDVNVVGALNANYAFYTGLADGRAFDHDVTEEELLADVWSQEPEIRQDTEHWIYSYLTMAYDPLPDDDLDAYIALSETRAGQALNAALFAGFDVVFTGISRELGLAAAQFIAGRDI